MPAQLPQDATSCGDQFRRMLHVIGAPDAVRVVPALGWNSRPAVDGVPVGRIMFPQLRESPAESQLAKHGEIGLRIGMEGVNERSVPVKKDATQFFAGVHRPKSNRKSRRFSPNILRNGNPREGPASPAGLR